MNPLMSAESTVSAVSTTSGESATSATSATPAPFAPFAPFAPEVTISSETGLTPLLAAWDLAHPSAADPDWRHLLDEIAHPHTTKAFHGLAATAV
ncbi:hypothetical protein ACFUIY_27580 [Streptomyces griseorubiginosus]|uniref:hypothetical protein n=1 Tax=Streptomyces griseorubiginosus TaxID=67304 RepID=UPI00363828B9